MSIRVALLCMLAASMCPAYESVAHHLRTQTNNEDKKKPTDWIPSVLKPTDKNEDKKKDEPAQKEKPMIGPIAVMRGEMCWARVELVGHVDCMDWLVRECTGKSFGTGLCRRVRAKVKGQCLACKRHENACEGMRCGMQKAGEVLGMKKQTDQCADGKACEYAKLLGIDVCKDKACEVEKVKEELDANGKDTDGDGVADNADDYPNDPECTTKKEPCPSSTAAVAVSPAAAPGPAAAPAPAAKEEAAAPAPAAKKEEAPKAPAPAPAKAPVAASAPAQFEAPDAKKGLASQGFSGKKVLHIDGETVTGDWGDEYGHKPEPSKSGAQSWSMNPWMCAAVAALAVVSAA